MVCFEMKSFLDCAYLASARLAPIDVPHRRIYFDIVDSRFPRRYLWRLTIRMANALAFVSITESDIHISFLKKTTNSALLTFYLLLLTFL